MSRELAGELVWLAWRVTEGGEVQTRMTRRRDDELVRVARDYDSLEEAAAELGPAFREVVERVLGEGTRRGRWRP